MITRRAVLALFAAGTCASVARVRAQAPGKIWRIGFLGLTASQAAVSLARVEALRAGLRDLGYAEGKNLAMEFRWANGVYERLPSLAEELVHAKVDVVVTYSTVGALAAKRATQTTPIVLASVGDPLSTGVVSSLARPGANVTGLAMFTPDEMAKRLELLKDAFPAVRRVAVLFNPDNPLGVDVSARAVKAAAERLNVEIQIFNLRRNTEFEGAFLSMVDKRAEAVIVFEDPLLSSEAGKLAALAIRHRLPAVGQIVFADAGGLMGNGSNQLELFRRAAVFIDRIFKGAKPGDLPIQQASRFELVINLNTATALGITLPKALLFRADRIIE